MATSVRVTKVTVEYEFGGKTFTVDFPDPSKIEAIVFSQTDLARLQAKQSEITGKVEDKPFKPGEPLPDVPEFSATSKLTGTNSAPVLASDRSLWWHTSSCSWFHPE